MRPLLNKLNSSQPITVAAFGDSAVSSMGGCFQRDGYEAYLHKQGAVPTPCGPTEHMVCKGYPMGWLAKSIFACMQQINATWPHCDHLLVNLGNPGKCAAWMNGVMRRA